MMPSQQRTSRAHLRFRQEPDNPHSNADVAKLVDARDLKSLGLARAGSTPAVRTKRLAAPKFQRLVKAFTAMIDVKIGHPNAAMTM
jgi:hypothetical protein